MRERCWSPRPHLRTSRRFLIWRVTSLTLQASALDGSPGCQIREAEAPDVFGMHARNPAPAERKRVLLRRLVTLSAVHARCVNVCAQADF